MSLPESKIGNNGTERLPSEKLSGRALRATAIKASLLADGVSIDNSINTTDSLKPQVIGLYVHSSDKIAHTPPQEIILDDFRNDGLEADGPFISNIRVNKASNTVLRYDNDRFLLERGGEQIQVWIPQKPNFYNALLESGVKASQIVQKLGSDGLGVVPNNYCSYFGSEEECRFCEILPNYLQARTYAKARKPVDQMAEAITIAAQSEDSMKYLFITTGNDPTYDETYEHYIDLLARIRPLMKERGITTFGVLMPPEDFSYIDKVHEAGLDTATFNLEVWNESLFNVMAPGKAAYGREKMLAALDHGVEVFGKGNMLTNLIYGIQSYEFGNKQWRFDPRLEEEILIEGTSRLLQRGILPTHTVYHTSGVNVIGPIRLDADAMLAYHLKYAELAYQSEVVPEDRFALFGGLGTVSNSMFNDAYVATSLLKKDQ